MERRKNIGVLIGSAQTYFPQEIISGIREAAEQKDVNAYIFLGTQSGDFIREITPEDNYAPFDYQFNSIYEYGHLGGFDGNIINYGTIGFYIGGNTNVDKFTAPFTKQPTVVLTDICSIPGVHSAISDNIGGIKGIVNGLIETVGCGKILFVRGPEDNTDANERLKGYLEAMSEHGLPVSAEMIACGDYSEFVDRQVETLLDENPDAEAIVFSNDLMAFAGYRVCEKRGLRVGKDIYISGYDNCERAEDMRPALTTVEQNGFALGKHSVESVVRMSDGIDEDCSVMRLPVDLIWRESTGSRSVSSSNRRKNETKDYEKEYVDLKNQLIRLQRYSWTLTLLARRLSDYIADEKVLCEKILSNLKYCKSENSYLFLLDKPVFNDGSQPITLPDDLRLAAYCRKGNVFAYNILDRPTVSRECTLSMLTKDDERHTFLVFLLFAGVRQYGILVCESNTEDYSFLYAASLQIGQVLQTMELNKATTASLQRLTKDIESIREKNRLLDMLSDYDELTGLLNLRGFRDGFNALDKSKTIDAYVAYCDLDHLKEINDTWGHIEGNYAIKRAGEILSECIRHGDYLARVGGDEYVCLIFSRDESLDEGFRQRVKKACEKENERNGKPYYVEISVGIHKCSITAETQLRDLLKLADSGLYRDKQSRRASVKKATACS